MQIWRSCCCHDCDQSSTAASNASSNACRSTARLLAGSRASRRNRCPSGGGVQSTTGGVPLPEAVTRRRCSSGSMGSGQWSETTNTPGTDTHNLTRCSRSQKPTSSWPLSSSLNSPGPSLSSSLYKPSPWQQHNATSAVHRVLGTC